MTTLPPKYLVLPQKLAHDLNEEGAQALRELQVMVQLVTVGNDMSFPMVGNDIVPWPQGLRIEANYPSFEVASKAIGTSKSAILCTAETDRDAISAQGWQIAFALQGPMDPVSPPIIPIAELSQLEFGWRQRHGHPISYEVTVTAVHEKYLRSFNSWLRREHLREVCEAGECFHAFAMQTSPVTLRSSYLFRSQAHLDAYLQDHAPALRAKTKANFPEEMLQFSRATFAVTTNY